MYWRQDDDNSCFSSFKNHEKLGYIKCYMFFGYQYNDISLKSNNKIKSEG